MTERPSKRAVEQLLLECASEPIHRLGSIQSHGVMVGWRKAEGDVVFGSQAPSPWLPASFEELAGTRADVLLRALQFEPTRQGAVGADGTLLRGQVFESGPFEVLELEAVGERPLDPVAFMGRVGDELRAASDLDRLCERVVHAGRELLGFDRVMLYRFDKDYNGQIVAESKDPQMGSYLGLRFPASDIPAQARELYRRNWVRGIADVDGAQIPIVRGPGYPLDEDPDLSMSRLRSVSPVHLEYLRNMKVRASMSMSVLNGDALWGLVACHHRTPHVVSPDQRTLGELLARIASMQVSSLVSSVRRKREHQVTAHRRQIQDTAFRAARFAEVFVREGDAILGLTEASGACIAMGRDLLTVGITPSREQLEHLASWMRRQVRTSYVSSSCIEELDPSLEGLRREASGILAVPLSADGRDFIAWFRPETVRTVAWAGNPDDKVTADESGRLHPRASFAEWKVKLRGKAEEWDPFHVEAGREFGWYIGEVMARRLEVLQDLNSERERRARDLDSFAYLAAHDLREPIRGMDAYVSFALQAFDAADEEELRANLAKVHGLLAETDGLLTALLEYARASSIKPRMRNTDLSMLVDKVATRLSGRAAEVGGHVIGPRAPTHVVCDSLVVQEIITNLVSNALKYGGEAPTVEVDWRPSNRSDEEVVITVKDHGIGIPDYGAEEIFKPFRRLHPKTAYGGGTGCGLAIVQALVDRHGGRVWFESEVDRGTTFYFSLGRSGGSGT
ncbi:MAG: ATP-binding protein [Myxococcota bacterium]